MRLPAWPLRGEIGTKHTRDRLWDTRKPGLQPQRRDGPQQFARTIPDLQQVQNTVDDEQAEDGQGQQDNALVNDSIHGRNEVAGEAAEGEEQDKPDHQGRLAARGLLWRFKILLNLLLPLGGLLQIALVAARSRQRGRVQEGK